MLLSNWADILFRCSFSASFRVLGWIRRRFNVRRMGNSQKKSDKKVCVGMRIMQVLAKSNIPANFSHHLCHHYMQRCRAFGSSRPRNPCNNQQMMKKNLFLKLEKDQPRLIPYSVANLIKKKKQSHSLWNFRIWPAPLLHWRIVSMHVSGCRPNVGCWINNKILYSIW